MEFVSYLIEYLVVYIFILIIEIMYTRIRFKKIFKNNIPTNIKYLMKKYDLDIKKIITYKELAKRLSFVDAFIVADIYIVSKLVDNMYVKFIVSFILILPIFAGTYYLVGKYLKRKIMKKESDKNGD